MGVAEQLVERARRHGPVPVDAVVEAALYDPAGFYETGGAAGRSGGDYLTSVEVGPLFGAVVARALDGWWREMGEPDPYVVVDAGAGPGTLCRTVLAARPDCARALRYVMVERSAAQRARHAERIALEEPALAFAPVHPDTEQTAAGLATGPICVSLARLPRVKGPAVVIANELLDNMPFGLAERRSGRWHEVRVGWDEGSPAATAVAAGSGGGRFVERLVPLDDERAALLDRLVPEAPEGARAPMQAAARRWLREARAVAGNGGRVVVADYAATTADMACRPQDQWLRTYRGHSPGGPWLGGLGSQDVTCEVAVDQLALVRPPVSDRLQADWLHHWGLGDLVEEGRRAWAAGASAPDVAALTGRSRLSEAAALTDPNGLGAFRVLEWPGT
ncbi:MAG TPA: SAM-dependent methyltransferase [Acidimicrobiales bacterium]|nr:SAM-dependent methyltransferase [Acidimicrobiales bacterium]